MHRTSKCHSNLWELLTFIYTFHTGTAAPTAEDSFFEAFDHAPLQSARGAFKVQDVAGCCRMLQDVAGCCRMLQDVAGCCRMLQDVAGCFLLMFNSGLILYECPVVMLQDAQREHHHMSQATGKELLVQ